ncbi:hypothetical protein [Streptomyces sp. NPDC096934]|uniref:hypothetical protein n=1 Tax=Streptomyces sp. NPDC096934 TaxID=3155551 RepID=UPI003330C374
MPSLQSPGTVLDRLSILKVKLDRLSSPANLALTATEQRSLAESWAAAKLPAPEATREFQLFLTLNSQLWALENQIRDAERRQVFGPLFIEMMSRINQLNGERARCRKAAEQAMFEARSVDLVEVECGLGAYADQIAIGRVQTQRDPSRGSRSWKVLRDLWIGQGLPGVFDGELFRALCQANDRLWTAKDDIQAALLVGTGRPQVYRSLYLINDARARVKRELGDSLGSALTEAKEYTPYAVPQAWDPRTLTWRGRLDS